MEYAARSKKVPRLNHGLPRNPERSGRGQPKTEKCDDPQSEGMASKIRRILAGYYRFTDDEYYFITNYWLERGY